MFVYTLCWILGFPTGYSKLSGGRKYFDWGGGGEGGLARVWPK